MQTKETKLENLLLKLEVFSLTQIDLDNFKTNLISSLSTPFTMERSRISILTLNVNSFRSLMRLSKRGTIKSKISNQLQALKRQLLCLMNLNKKTILKGIQRETEILMEK